MSRWNATTRTALVLSGLFGAALPAAAQQVPGAKADPRPALESADKLPVDLPSVLIRGEDETAGPLLPGNKLSPDEPGKCSSPPTTFMPPWPSYLTTR